MTTFIAIYRGQTVGDAKLIAVSAESSIVAEVTQRLLKNNADEQDLISNCLENGRRSALNSILKEIVDERNQ